MARQAPALHGAHAVVERLYVPARHAVGVVVCARAQTEPAGQALHAAVVPPPKVENVPAAQGWGAFAAPVQ